MKREMERLLCRLGEQFDQAKILWGVAASLVLYANGIVDEPSDIDILTTQEDMDRAFEILSTMGELQKQRPSELYQTERFYEFRVGPIEVDLFCGFKICNYGITYEYLFDEASVCNQLAIEGRQIPVGALEDWLILYYMMGRRAKYEQIREYLKANGLTAPHLLSRAFREELPSELREQIHDFV